MSKFRWLILLMGMVIIVVTGFQVYWLKDNYDREKKAVELRTRSLFRETVHDIQDSLLQEKLRIAMKDTSRKTDFTTEIKNTNGKIRMLPRRRAARVLNVLNQKALSDSVKNSLKGKTGIFVSLSADAKYKTDSGARLPIDSLVPDHIREMVIVNARPAGRTNSSEEEELNTSKKTMPPNRLVRLAPRPEDTVSANITQSSSITINDERGQRFMIRLDTLFTDSIPPGLLNRSFTSVLHSEKLDLPFTVHRDRDQADVAEDIFAGRVAERALGYKLVLGNTFPYLLRQIRLPILFSLFLVGITLLSFILLYRNMQRQQRLAVLKNDLISNITHELKTPIATVGVAIEALKDFNAIQNPERTKEYLEISQHELQRLGLLVDKVLKLSMFEKKEIEIKKEVFNLQGVVDEVVASLRLQVEKYHARITTQQQGDLHITGDRLHLLSVVFNLLDNALKYSKGNPAIQVSLKEENQQVVLEVTDNGIGIPASYRDKVFEKFFRVPAGDTHNAKGHGLGLSYVAQVVRQHQGTISLDSHEGLGSTFTIRLPKAPAST